MLFCGQATQEHKERTFIGVSSAMLMMIELIVRRYLVGPNSENAFVT